MNKREVAVQKDALQDERKLLEELQKSIQEAMKECQQKIDELNAREDMQNIKSIVFQRKYQEIIKKQLEGIFDKLLKNEYKTVAEYLNDCYINGWVGELYNLQGQGVPLLIPINQEQVVQAIKLDSKLVKPYYDRLGEDVTKLKKAVKQDVSIGVASGLSYFEIGRRLIGKMTSPFPLAYYNAVRIARTEGHRIQQESQYQAGKAAVERGAKIKKQWDSTIDARTRMTHAMLDHQIREIEEPFEVDGKKAMYPGAFGRPEEDINCRCTCLHRAEWALGGAFAKFNGFTNQAEMFDSDEAYESFKKKYFSPENMKYMKYVQTLEKRYDTKNFKKIMETMTDREYKHYSELLAATPIYKHENG